ncbi:MAG: cysteine--tRNA ligase [Microthrixaceae bacterium]
MASASPVRTPLQAALRLFDTRRRTVEPFEPLDPPRVGIYTCGPTVYAPQHLGNMRSQLTPDLLRRLLVVAGYDVTYVTNITDVGHLTDDGDDGDDKVEAAAARTGRTAAGIARFYTDQWATDRRRLGCLEPDELPRAADHIAEQIQLIQSLEAGGHTYVIDDGVYFDIATFPAYSDFAGLNVAAQTTTGRVGATDAKRNPADFALWKLTPPGVKRQQEWESPWGRGFPGWHIECSAMSMRYLGETFDIHTGGIDHIGVHHTNEIAQSECALGVHPWVRYWVHNEFLNLSGAKMSKSAGDVLCVDTLIDRGYDPLAFRYLFLTAHYRQQQDFTWEAMDQAAAALRRLRMAAATARSEAVGAGQIPADAALPEPIPGNNSELVRELLGAGAALAHSSAFWQALADDLASPKAVAVLWEALRDGGLGAGERWALLADVDRALGLGLAAAVDPDSASESTGTDDRIDALLAERHQARAQRNFGRADAIRDELAAEGIAITDTADGATWRRT